MNVWVKGLLAGLISGAANGLLNGLAACGIAPDRFNLQHHSGNLFAFFGLSVLFGGAIGLTCYLKQSPLP